jgi:hypothetical protein
LDRSAPIGRQTGAYRGRNRGKRGRIAVVNIIPALIRHRAVLPVLDSPANGGEKPSAVRAAAIWRRLILLMFVA